MSKWTLNVLSIILFFSLVSSGCNGNMAQVPVSGKTRAWEDMGRSLIMQGNLRGGLAYLLKALEIEPENADLNHELAIVYRDLGEYNLSLIHFKKTLSLRPRFPEAYNNLGTLYLLMNNWDFAIDSFKNATGDLLYKTPYFAYNNMGWAYFNKGEYEKAIENYRLALKEFPGYGACHANMGMALEAMGRLSEAIDSYKKAIGYEPDYPPPYYLLGKLYFRQNRMGEALIALKDFTLRVKEGPEAEEAKRLINIIENR